MTDVPAQGSSNLERVILLIIVAIMLNVGLFFILVVFAPLVAGLVVGYLIEEQKGGTLTGFIGTFLSYSAIMLYTEYLTGFATDLLVILAAILIMGLIGAVGGLLGALIRTRTR